jgi:hypothetical protein
MNIDVIKERIEEIRENDQSFNEPETLFTRLLGIHTVSQEMAREVWFKGIEVGMMEGILLSEKMARKKASSVKPIKSDENNIQSIA